MSAIDPILARVQHVRWHCVADALALQARACRWILDAAMRAIDARGRFSIVLAGGNTPRGVYTQLCGASSDWARWEIWFGDERCLPLADPQRNSTMAFETWLAHVPIPAHRIHLIPADLGAAAGARAYRETLHAAAHDRAVAPGQRPQLDDFDLVLLGLGEDGHTASLFPRHDWGTGTDSPDTLAVLDAPKPPSHRISLSAARLSRAREVVFLVEGESKRDAVAQWRAGVDIAAAAIRPLAGVDVLVDASLLSASEGVDS